MLGDFSVAVFSNWCYDKILIEERAMTKFTYNFETSQKLTDQQLAKINEMLENYWMEIEEEELVPEWTTLVEEQK
jgi:hypothetical protein